MKVEFHGGPLDGAEYEIPGQAAKRMREPDNAMRNKQPDGGWHVYDVDPLSSSDERAIYWYGGWQAKGGFKW